MSFTVTCDKCGNKQTFTSESSKYSENIDINVYTSGSFQGEIIDTIDIECNNPKCNNEVSLKY